MSRAYSLDLQKLFLEIMLYDSESFVRIQNIFNPKNFDEDLIEAAKFIGEHATEYKVLPDHTQVKAMTGFELDTVDNLGEGQLKWFLEEFESFTKRKELERAILSSVDLIEKGEFDPVQKLITDAVQIGLPKNLGTDYFEDPKGRLLKLRDNNGRVSTGWPALDRKLFGGMNQGELNIFAGPSGSGKSLFLQNLALNWLLNDLNGVFITLELSEELCALRFDSMLTGISTRNVFKELDDVVLKLGFVNKKAGNLNITYLPAQSTINNIRSVLKELEIKNRRKADFVIVDYLDLLMPVSAKVSPNDLFVKDKYVSEELRNLSKELGVLFATASQLNRSAVEEIEYDHSHIAGGISKINTADNVFGIFTSRTMRERGRYQLQLMKTRSSSGVGQKIELEFDIDCLRIRDLGDQEEAVSVTSSILGQIKPKSVLTETDIQTNDSDSQPKVNASIQSSKLKNMLKSLKTEQ